MAGAKIPGNDDPPASEIEPERTLAGRLARWMQQGRVLGKRIEAAGADHVSIDVGFDVVERDSVIGGGLFAGALAYRMFVLLLPSDTEDWYAQDRKGNVWYMGEATKEYSRGRVSTEGSWRAGVNGAQPGIIVPAHPRIGASYRQEYLKGHAEDNARNMSVDEQLTVPQGHYDHALMTRETTPLEPKVLEYKFYARGVGPLLAISVSPDLSFERLISFKRGS